MYIVSFSTEPVTVEADGLDVICSSCKVYFGVPQDYYYPAWLFPCTVL
jgi:hypothetical protein